jgi:single stranded DNA-binding protein
MNSFNLSGRLTRDPELRPVGSTKVCTFTIANNRVIRSKRGADGAEKIEITLFMDGELWGNAAAYFADVARKGTFVEVRGPVEMDKFTGKDGNSRTRFKIKVEDFDIPVRPAKTEVKAETTAVGTSDSNEEDPF